MQKEVVSLKWCQAKAARLCPESLQVDCHFPTALTANPVSLHLFPMLCPWPLGRSQQPLTDTKPTPASQTPPEIGMPFLPGLGNFSIHLGSTGCDSHDASSEHRQHGLKLKSSDASRTQHSKF